MGKKKYDIFISYRRVGGEATARILCERLTDLGYSVFFDVESLRSGDFNTKLYSVIEDCSDFLIVLSPDSMERCRDENDWVRLEITHALKNNKNIIPIMLRGFSFPSYLPLEIDNLRYKNGIEANSEFFDAFIDKLRGFLKTKTTLTRRIYQNTVFRRTLPFVIALFVTAGLIFGGFTIYDRNFKTKVFPASQEEKNITNEVLDYVGRNLMNYNLIVGKAQEAYKACDNYLSSPNAVEYENVVSTIQKSQDYIIKLDIKKDVLKSGLDSKVDKTPIKKDDLMAVNSIVEQLQKEVQDDLTFVHFLLGPDALLQTSAKKQVLQIYMDLLEVNRKNIVYGINDLLLPVGSKFITDFKHNTLTLLTNLPFDENRWLTDKADIENQSLVNTNKAQELISKFSAIVGNENVEYAKAVSSFREELKKIGLSEGEIDKQVAEIIKKSDDITRLKREIGDKEKELAEQYAKAQDKFKPLDTDSTGILWGKMLRFLNLGLYEDAVKCLQMFHQKMRIEDKNADIYVPVVMEFIKSIKNTGIDYGVLVIGYDPEKGSHEIYKIGDIIVAVNGKQCLNTDAYINFKVKEGDEITLFRMNSDGKLTTIKAAVVKNQSKAWFANLTERE